MIIGISGHKQSGKNTLARLLNIMLTFPEYTNKEIKDLFYLDYDNFQFKIVAFADTLKQISAILLGCDVKDFESETFKNKLLPEGFCVNKNITTYREFLQYLGTELLSEHINPNIWVNTLINKLSPEHNYIITDVRFPKEVEAIKKQNGIVIRINPIYPQNDNHISESALDNYTNFDYYIDNDYKKNKDLDILINQLRSLLKT